MQPYRLYFLREGHIASGREQLCESDEAAISWAEAQSDGRAMELWRLAQLVKYFPRTPERTS